MVYELLTYVCSVVAEEVVKRKVLQTECSQPDVVQQSTPIGSRLAADSEAPALP